MTIFLIVLCGIIFYVYLGYPAVTVLAGSLLRRRVRKGPVYPKVSIIIAAYNEADTIQDKLENCLGQDYPSGKLEILVASDGSTDATTEIVRRHAPRVQLLDLPRQGKLQALDRAVAESAGEILVFSDANILFKRDAVRRLVENFADPEVGGVAGSKVYGPLKDSESSAEGERLYWSYDQLIKRLESLTGSVVSADGSIYAIRRSLYSKPVRSDVTDDFAISTQVVASGARLVFEPLAIGNELPVATAQREFSRKVRLMTRGLTGVIMRRRLLNPFKFGYYSLALLSRKLLRRLVPLFLILLWVLSAWAALGNPFAFRLWLLQSAFYLLAGFGFLTRRTRLGRLKPLMAPFFYCLANAAALIAVYNVATGRRYERWEPQRHASAGSQGS